MGLGKLGLGLRVLDLGLGHQALVFGLEEARRLGSAVLGRVLEELW